MAIVAVEPEELGQRIALVLLIQGRLPGADLALEVVVLEDFLDLRQGAHPPG